MEQDPNVEIFRWLDVISLRKISYSQTIRLSESYKGEILQSQEKEPVDSDSIPVSDEYLNHIAEVRNDNPRICSIRNFCKPWPVQQLR